MVISRTAQVRGHLSAPRVSGEPTRAIVLPAIAFVVASIISGGLNLGYQRLFGTDLDEDARGALRAVLAALAGFGFFATGLQVAFASMMDGGTAAGASRRHLLRLSVLIAAASATVALVTGLIWLPDGGSRPSVAALIAAFAFISVLSALPRARLLIHRRWTELAVTLLASALVKFGGAVAARSSGATLRAALLGLVAAEAVAFVVAQRAASRSTPKLRRGDDPSPNYRPLAISVAALSGLWALTGLDSVIARVSLPAGAADSYSAASSVARLAFFAPATIAWLSLPDFIGRRYGHEALRRTLSRALVAVGLVSAVTATFVIVFPTQLHRLVAPDSDVLSVGSARWLAAAWSLFGLSSLLVFFHVAQRSRLALVPWGGALIVALGTLVVGEQPSHLASVVLLGASVTTVVLLAPALTRVKPVTHAIEATPRHHTSEVLESRDVAIVVPCFNPGPVVVETLHRIAASLRDAAESFEVIAVSDGSTDGSPDLIDAIDADWLRHVRCETNGGKGRALRFGFAAAHASVVGFIDADGDLPPEQLPDYLRAMRDYQADVVLGSKRHPDSHLDVPAWRTVYSWGYQRLVRILFRLDIHDTQTGIKLFRRELVEQTLPVLEEDGFALDLEIFVVARAAGFNKLVEMPVRLEHQFNSTISSRSAVTMLVSTLRLFWRARMSLIYVRKVDLLTAGTERTDGGTTTG